MHGGCPPGRLTPQHLSATRRCATHASRSAQGTRVSRPGREASCAWWSSTRWIECPTTSEHGGQRTSRPLPTRGLFTNARTGDGVQRLARLALSVSEGVNQRRAEKGLRPRPVRAAVVGFPNVGKSALINRLLGRAQCASAQRPGVTRHLQWVSLGPEGSLMLLDAPGVLPMRLADQHAAIRLAICNDIGEASYTTSLVAAQFVELLRKHPTQGRQRMASLEQRYRISAAGLTGEDYILAMAEKHCGGEVERAGRKLLKDYQEGKLGTFGLDVVPPYESSGAERDAHRAPPPQQQQQVGTVWQPDGPSRRVVKEAEKAARRGDIMPSSL
jgi:ribosome biogenesis GTPase A